MNGFTRYILTIFAIVLATPVLAQSPVGVWLDEERNAHIEIYKCSERRSVSRPGLLSRLCRQTSSRRDRLCGRVSSITKKGLRELKKSGKSVSSVMHAPILCVSPTSKNMWKGGLYSVYKDVNASGTVKSLSRSRIFVKGCKFVVVCIKDYWSRVR